MFPRGQYSVQSCSVYLGVQLGWRDRVYPQQVCWWHETGRNGWYTGRLCWHPVRPRQERESGDDHDEIQQGQMQGPTPGEEQPQASVQSWGWPTGEQLCGEWPGCPGGWQIDREPAVCPGCQEGWWYPGVH